MAGNREYDQTKLENLVLYLAERSRDDVGYGKIKLNKLLFRSDFEAYRLLGHSITGEEYKHQELGPVAAHLPSLLRRLSRNGELVVEAIPAGPHERLAPVPTGSRTADTTVFDDAELAIIDATLDELREHGGASVSRWSHQASVGWRVHNEENALIPYSSALLSIRGLSDRADAALRARFASAA
jgi:hypothetical protein